MAKKMQLILPLNCDDEYADIPSHAQVSVDQDMIDFIHKAVTQIGALGAYKIIRWDSVDTYFKTDYEREGDPLVEYEDFRTECEQFVVRDTSVQWLGLVKDTSAEWSTSTLSLEELEEAWEIYTVPKEKVPLYINKLQHDMAKKIFNKRMGA